MDTLVAFWNILRKDIENYYLKPPNISWGIIFPLSWALMLFMRSQQAVEIIEILPGLMAMSVLFGTTSMLAVTITFERKGRSFDRLLLAPISLKVMVLAKIIGSVLFGMFNAFVPIIFGAFLSDLSGVNWGFVFIGVLFIAFSSTLVGLVIAVSAKEIFEAQTYSNFFRFPMIFLCGLFFPVSTLPIFLRPLSYALPLTYGVDILHIALVKSGMMSVWLDILILSVFSVLLFYISMRNIQRKWIL
ncbi:MULTISPECIES: ABC transporter permease [Oscillospiraceae]|jgi:ABC-2 type transport system permease protein|uniref:Transport permease protein n=2 Tax=Oscillospiraceae TaxID=216572 RepID=A0A4U7J7S7_9FIRM|nr:MULTISPECIES: ABC transporter permease [Oscillospiraceae]AEV70029.1 putative membrane protein [Acetivibrio clariflavus DSM 19732]QNU66344.1 ABC transporter permease [Ruminiclostridium herbifermentans]